jgi:short subunit dehydrogenase-like uncharacterized protein
MTKRVLIIGGYGHFGGYIARSLAGEDGLRLLIAGRSHAKAQRFASQLAARNTPEAVALDIAGDIAPVLAEVRPEVVVHTTGPFQNQGYGVAEACLRRGCHYIDLADAREFVGGIVRYDGEARDRNLLVVSGASSVPCLTAAVIDHYRPRFAALERVEYGISAAQRTNRGLATAISIIGAAGKAFTTLAGGRPRAVYGWQNLHARRYPELGWRLFGNCDAPDLALFPSRYPELKTIHFSAGIEVKALHLGLWGLSWLVRLRAMGSLTSLAPYLLKLSSFFDVFGSDRGGFHMFLSSTGNDGRPAIERFYLIAGSGDGPFIPCAPAILLAKGLAAGTVATRGARPCLDLIDLETYLAALKGLDIATVTESHHG